MVWRRSRMEAEKLRDKPRNSATPTMRTSRREGYPRMALSSRIMEELGLYLQLREKYDFRSEPRRTHTYKIVEGGPSSLCTTDVLECCECKHVLCGTIYGFYPSDEAAWREECWNVRRSKK